MDQLVEMGRALHAESPVYRDEPFEPAVLREWIWQRMNASLMVDDSAVFVHESGGRITGVLVGIICASIFNRRKSAIEVTFCIPPEHRGGRTFHRLVTAYKAWAKRQGASKASLGVSTGIHAEGTVRAYSRAGFRLDGYTATTQL
jgi:RimJ/RimL family protein N-acetyltransferase